MARTWEYRRHSPQSRTPGPHSTTVSHPCASQFQFLSRVFRGSSHVVSLQASSSYACICGYVDYPHTGMMHFMDTAAHKVVTKGRHQHQFHSYRVSVRRHRGSGSSLTSTSTFCPCGERTVWMRQVCNFESLWDTIE